MLSKLVTREPIKETISHAARQEMLIRSHLSSLSHSGLILAQRVVLVHHATENVQRTLNDGADCRAAAGLEHSPDGCNPASSEIYAVGTSGRPC